VGSTTVSREKYFVLVPYQQKHGATDCEKKSEELRILDTEKGINFKVPPS